jgi:flagellar basal body P-ring formation protein FlgA
MSLQLTRHNFFFRTLPPLLGIIISFSPVFFEASALVRLDFFDSAVVNDTVLRLGDIAAISGDPDGETDQSYAKLPIGEAAPAGYSRYVNTGDVVLNSLKGRNISADFPKAKRIRVRTDFQECGISGCEEYIRRQIYKKIGWDSASCQIKIKNLNEKWKCLKRPYSVSVEGFPTQYPRGNSNCKLIVSQLGKQIIVPMECIVTVCLPVVIASVKIKRGEVLSSENCRTEKIDITHFKYMPYRSLSEIKNQVISRTINPGTIIHDKLCAPVPAIHRDEMVQLIVIKGRIRASIMARARESGVIGENILVENEMTHKIVKAQIKNHGQVVLFQGDGNI